MEIIIGYKMNAVKEIVKKSKTQAVIVTQVKTDENRMFAFNL